MNAPLKESLSYSTIEKLNTLRNTKLPIKTLGILFKNAINTDLHRDTELIRSKIYGKSFANQIIEIRMMSKKQLNKYKESINYVVGYNQSYIYNKLSKKDKYNVYNLRQLYTYASTRLKLTIN
tara:strand:+ start:2242 stop:2610 length:369 start_codon:yes stop_codon:yes gene_type:complete